MPGRWAQKYGSMSPWGHTGTKTMHETLLWWEAQSKPLLGTSQGEVLGSCTISGCTLLTPTRQLLTTLCWNSLPFVKSWLMFLRPSCHTSTWGECTQMSTRSFTLCSPATPELSGPLVGPTLLCGGLGQPWLQRLWGLTLSYPADLGRPTVPRWSRGQIPCCFGWLQG